MAPAEFTFPTMVSVCSRGVDVGRRRRVVREGAKSITEHRNTAMWGVLSDSLQAINFLSIQLTCYAVKD